MTFFFFFFSNVRFSSFVSSWFFPKYEVWRSLQMGGCSLKVLVPVLGISCHWLGSAQDSRLTFSTAFVFAFVKYQKLQLCANSSFGQCWAWLACWVGFWAAALWALHCYKLQSRWLLSAWLSCSSVELPLVGFCFNTGNARAAGRINLLDSTQILWTPNSLLRATIKVTILIHQISTWGSKKFENVFSSWRGN